MFRGIFFLFLVNFIIVITLSVVLQLLGVGNYVTAQGLDVQSLLMFCLVWGMGGAFISLLLSKKMAKWMMGVQIIEPQTRDSELHELVQQVHGFAKAAGLNKMPEVGIYDSPEINAFATGPSKSNSLVAVSTGLLKRMKSDEVNGVLAHEVAHIANGDMVAMTLIQGVVNAFVMFLARIIAFAIDQATRSQNDRDRGSGGLGAIGHFFVVIVLENLFMLAAMFVVSWFSRQREFRADAGGARLAGRDSMIAALERLKANFNGPQEAHATQQNAFSALQISNRRGILALLSTHPSLDERIERLTLMTS